VAGTGKGGGGAPARITVVGLGPAGPELRPAAADRALGQGSRAFVRTRHHPAAADLPDEVVSLDHHYEESSTFEDVYRGIVDELIDAARTGGPVVYAVPGSPLVAERTVELLRDDPRAEVTVVPALSFLDLAWDRLGVDPLAAGVRLVDGTRFAVEAAGERGPMLVAQCWSATVLSEVKLCVDTDLAPGPLTATLLHHLGLPDERVMTVGWDDLDRALEPDHLTSVWVPRLGSPVAADMAALEGLVRRLRQDCPWDREQTHASLTRHLLEEAYEVIDAVDELTRAEAGEGSEKEAVDHLEEELGDLLFQVFFHSRLAAEEGRFDLAEVARGVHDKLVARHPHVFGDVVAEDPGTVVANWEEIKKAEKGRQSVTDGIPASLPALALASKLAGKARAVDGFDLPGFEEERASVAAALAGLPDPGAEGPGPVDLARRVGDLFFVLADMGRRLGVDPEDATRSAALRFKDEVRRAEEER
jgi:tetrapyrrole methylase family protein/MazG family protein